VSYPKPAPEYEFEAELGLPEPLPEDERLLWQGAPDRSALSARVFQVRKLALYFAVMLALRAWWLAGEGLGALAFAKAFAPALFLSAVGFGLMLLIAWASWRTTLYTITTKRVVMRIGVVLTVSFNLPLRQILAADWTPTKANDPEGIGSIALRLRPSDKIAYFHLWPHARPWQFKHPQPMLRFIPHAKHVATLLTQAWQQQTGVAGQGRIESVNRSASPVVSGRAEPLSV
jgi:hypothetical protein